MVFLFYFFLTLIPLVPTMDLLASSQRQSVTVREKAVHTCAPSGERISFHTGSALFARCFFSFKLRNLCCADIGVLFNEVKSDTERGSGCTGPAWLRA